jgi:predicted porin
LTGDVAGKVWVSAISQKVEGLSYLTTDLGDDRTTAFDIGTTVNVAGFGPAGKSRDSDQWYVQATYVLPTTTKVGVSYGESTLDGNSADNFNDPEDSMWTVGAYHPITKHLNLFAEYSEAERDRDNTGSIADVKAKAKTISLGAILFF